ncbi:rhomboid family intramembrane serine protease [Fervidibacillus albus]|uniref:Rhomboid family intramembrane serine protease n=1 Tax=Fervidibacillus albus TaxID=2980026 RepID=A0A9E8LVR2_9BACI|nr:rhomboid family intramembrane serine protease [Fervidibacillus albus]WAA10416.1 rhomboid family intramembrane serine protease [Fervidibacillus albus]
MSFKEEYYFWRIVYYLMSEKKYRMLNLSPNENEVWLENVFEKQHGVVKIVRTDLDWSNWLRNDVERTKRNGERIRQSFYKNRLNVFNLYITPLPPVDDYETALGWASSAGNERVKVYTSLFLTNDLSDSLADFEQFFGKLPIDPVKDVYEPYEVDAVKKAVMQLASAEVKRERKIFEAGKPFFTYFFLAVQVVLFFLMELMGGSENPYVLLQFGAKFNPLIVEGQWWRLITPMFLHIGIIHLLLNSLALYYLGTVVEKLFGRWRFLFLYLFSGFFGSLASFLFNPTISAGASGAIFGCFGALLYFGLVYPHLFFRTMGMNILVLVGMNLLLGIIIPNIDMAGHVGGLIGGFLASGILYLPKQDRFNKRWLFFLVTVMATAGMLVYGFTFPNV